MWQVTWTTPTNHCPAENLIETLKRKAPGYMVTLPGNWFYV